MLRCVSLFFSRCSSYNRVRVHSLFLWLAWLAGSEAGLAGWSDWLAGYVVDCWLGAAPPPSPASAAHPSLCSSLSGSGSPGPGSPSLAGSGWLVWLAGWLAGSLGEWSVGWLAGWLAGLATLGSTISAINILLVLLLRPTPIDTFLYDLAELRDVVCVCLRPNPKNTSHNTVCLVPLHRAFLLQLCLVSLQKHITQYSFTTPHHTTQPTERLWGLKVTPK